MLSRVTAIKRTNAATLVAFVQDNAPEGGTIVTDEFRAYNGLGALGYTHKTVRHSAGEYVRDMAHTNGIEIFWSLLKRGYIGVCHYMSEQHLHRYITEFSFRHNTAQVGTVAFINMTIDRMVDKRLTYKDPFALCRWSSAQQPAPVKMFGAFCSTSTGFLSHTARCGCRWLARVTVSVFLFCLRNCRELAQVDPPARWELGCTGANALAILFQPTVGIIANLYTVPHFCVTAAPVKRKEVKHFWHIVGPLCCFLKGFVQAVNNVPKYCPLFFVSD